MFNFKFSKKKIISILFLFAALLISLFLGSYNFLTFNGLKESLDNMENSSSPAPASAATPSSSIPPLQDSQLLKNTKSNMFGLSEDTSPPASITPALSPAAAAEQEINTLLNNYVEKAKSSPAA